MRDVLLSLASPESLSWAGFLLLALGLLGEVGVLVLPAEKHFWHNVLGFVFAAVVLVGYVIGHIGDDAIGARSEARATEAELELTRIKEERKIRPDQRAKLVACLRPGPKGPVYIRPGVLDTDGPKLGKQLEEIFTEVEFPLPQWRDTAMVWNTAGWFLIVADMKNAPAHATLIQKCFWQADLPIYGQEDKTHPEDAVSIGIGPRL
jgi:hypothetical protein